MCFSLSGNKGTRSKTFKQDFLRHKAKLTRIPDNKETAVLKLDAKRKIVETAVWPTQWKKEYVTPIGKVPEPGTEDDLRPISLTPFFSTLL